MASNSELPTQDLKAAPAAMRFLSVEPLLEDAGKLPLGNLLFDSRWESGPGARPMKVGWVLSIREQCEAAKIPFFFKNAPRPNPR